MAHLTPPTCPRPLLALAASGVALCAVAACDEGASGGLAWGAPACAPLVESCLDRMAGCAVEGGVAACAPCPAGTAPVRPLGACEALAAPALSHTFGAWTLEPGDEVSSLCESWVLDNDEELFVNAVELASPGGVHHHVLFFVPEDHRGWPTGTWLDCYAQGFNELEVALAGGILVASSTEVPSEFQRFGSGAAVRIPPRSRVIAAAHLLNSSAERVTTSIRASLHTVAAVEVEARLVPGQLVVPGLTVPPEGASTFSGRCDVAATYEAFAAAPLAMRVHGFLPHVHPSVTAMEVRVVGGPEDGRLLVDLGAYEAAPLGHVFDPPVDLAGATGLSLSCSYEGALAQDPAWGHGHEEKCETLLYLESDMAFAGVILPAAAPRVEPDGQVFEGACQGLGFPYDDGE